MTSPEGLPQTPAEALKDVKEDGKIASYLKPGEVADAEREEVAPGVNQLVSNGQVVGFESATADEDMRKVSEETKQAA